MYHYSKTNKNAYHRLHVSVLEIAGPLDVEVDVSLLLDVVAIVAGVSPRSSITCS